MTQNIKILPLDNEQILSIYKEVAPQHFPQAELKPVSSIHSLLERRSYLGLGMFDNSSGELIGYSLFIRVPELDTVLLDYYAVMPGFRNLGIGSIFLEGMKENFSYLNGILLETEDPDAAPEDEEKKLRNRRNDFYLRNGARFTSISSSLYHVPFHILYISTGNDPGDIVLREHLEAIYRFMLPGESYDKYVRWD